MLRKSGRADFPHPVRQFTSSLRGSDQHLMDNPRMRERVTAGQA